MGWAKYLEDNISICNDRMYYREGAYDSPKEHNRQKCNTVRFQVMECNAKQSKPSKALWIRVKIPRFS